MTANALATEARMTGKVAGRGMSVESALKAIPKVEERPVYFGDDTSRRRIEIKGQKALINPETEEVFSIVTDDYQLIRHEQVIEMAESVVDEMTEYGKPERRVWLPQDGAKMRLQYTFPEAAMTVAGDTDGGRGIAPSFDAFNSLDGSIALRAIFGAYRIICSNGMTVGTKEIEYRREHHQPMDGTHDMKAMIIVGMKRFSDQVGIWEKWVDRVTTLAEYENIVTGLKLNKTQTEDLHREVEVSSGVRLEDQKLQAITLWAFYNIVTQFITHRIENQVVQQRMMGRVRRLFH